MFPAEVYAVTGIGLHPQRLETRDLSREGELDTPRMAAWRPAARDKGSGSELANQYRHHGLKLLQDHAPHEAGGMGVEQGITEMLERVQTGRFKVFRGQEQWIEEFRYYRRQDGLIVKERDDLNRRARPRFSRRGEHEVSP
jgi:hypothetical protein